MARQAALAMMSFGGEGGMPGMGNFLRNRVAQIMQYVLLRGVDHVCMWGACSHIERECLAAAAAAAAAYQSPRTTLFENVCVGGGWGILSAMFVNSVAAGLSKHELINYAFRAACTAHLIPQNN
jgi:hypothetical protein